MRVLIDSDVFLDFILEREPFADKANGIFEHLESELFEAYVCAITPTTVFYSTRKAKGLDGAFAAVRDLLVAAKTCPVDGNVLSNALGLSFSDYEDAVQCASAMAENLDAIVTRNTKDYKKSPIPVYSPIEFLEVLQKIFAL